MTRADEIRTEMAILESEIDQIETILNFDGAELDNDSKRSLKRRYGNLKKKYDELSCDLEQEEK